MLIIRLQRIGRKNDPAFRVVCAEKHSKPHAALEILGSYHPKTKVSSFKHERILYWISKGAQPSATAHNLFISKGVLKGEKIHVAKEKLKKKNDTAKSAPETPVSP